MDADMPAGTAKICAIGVGFSRSESHARGRVSSMESEVRELPGRVRCSF